MNIIKFDLHCPYCGKTFDLELEENATQDDLIEECPLCGHGIDIQLMLSPEGKIIDAEIHRIDGDTDE